MSLSTPSGGSRPSKFCKHCRSLLWDYLAGETSPKESAALAEHLKQCPSCAAEKAKLEQVLAVFREDTPPLPEGFSQNLHRKLALAAEEMAKEKSFIPTPSPRWRSWQTMVPALACLALAIGIFSGGHFQRWLKADDVLTAPTPTSSSVVETPLPEVEVVSPAVDPVIQSEPAPTWEAREIPAEKESPSDPADIAQTPVTAAEPITPPVQETPSHEAAPPAETSSGASKEEVPVPAAEPAEALCHVPRMVSETDYLAEDIPTENALTLFASISLYDPMTVLDRFEESYAADWQRELLADGSVLLTLSAKTWQDFSDYLQGLGIITEPLDEDDLPNRFQIMICEKEE